MTHLELLNAVLALRFRQPGWPTVLADNDYLVHGIGVTMLLPDGSRVAPDVLASASARHLSLLLEVKSGANLDHDQLGRLEQVTTENLRDLAYLPIRDLSAHRVAIVYFCNQKDFGELVAATAGRRVSLVGFDGTRFHLGGRELPDDRLQSSLTDATVSAGASPLDLVPFDQHSDASTVARSVLTELVRALLVGSGSVTAEGLLQTTHHIVHGVMKSTGAGSELREVQKRVTDILREAAANEFADWITPVKGQPMWQFARAISADRSAKTRELQALQRAALALITRLGGTTSVQLDLFGPEGDGPG